jgi:hypothetical protein
VLGADSNSDHPSSYPPHRPACIDHLLNPWQSVPAGTGKYSFDKLFLNNDLERLSYARCESSAALNCGEVMVGDATGK